MVDLLDIQSIQFYILARNIDTYTMSDTKNYLSCCTKWGSKSLQALSPHSVRDFEKIYWPALSLETMSKHSGYKFVFVGN